MGGRKLPQLNRDTEKLAVNNSLFPAGRQHWQQAENRKYPVECHPQWFCFICLPLQGKLPALERLE